MPAIGIKETGASGQREIKHQPRSNAYGNDRADGAECRQPRAIGLFP
jgi:hypothetical protein